MAADIARWADELAAALVAGVAGSLAGDPAGDQLVPLQRRFAYVGCGLTLSRQVLLASPNLLAPAPAAPAAGAGEVAGPAEACGTFALHTCHNSFLGSMSAHKKLDVTTWPRVG